MWGWIFAAAFVVGLGFYIANRRAEDFEKQRRAYIDLMATRGSDYARAQCRHKYTTQGQTGTPGVVSMTTKWCRVCGAYLG